MAIDTNLDPPSEPTLEEALDALRAAGNAPRREGPDEWVARCTAHDDHAPSMALTRGDKRPLMLYCRSKQCAYEDMLAGIFPDREWPQPVRRNTPPSATTSHRQGLTLAATYAYADELGEVLYEVRRFEPKTFRQRKPDGNGGWVNTLGDVRRVLYGLPRVLEAVTNGEPVYLVEGEKDADRILELGIAATTMAGGSAYSKRTQDATEILKPLAGCALAYIVADRDAPGREHAKRVARILEAWGVAVELLEPAIVTDKADVSDHLDAGKALHELEPMRDYPQDQDEAEAPQEQLQELHEGIRAHIELVDIDDLLANPPPDPDYTWGNPRAGYIERGTLCVLHGDGGLGKSLIGQGLCRAYTQSAEHLGQDTAGGVALYLDGENSLAEIARRLYAFNIRPGEKRLIYGRAHMPVLLDPNAGEALLEELINETGATLLVLDSQRALWGGDEREQLEVRPMFAMLARVAERLEVAILLIHHDNKSGLYSGSTDINAAVVSRIHLERRSSKDKSDRRRTLTHEKSRSGPEVDPITFTIDKDTEGRLHFNAIDEDDDEQAAETRRIPRDNVREDILDMMADRTPRRRAEAAKRLQREHNDRTFIRAWNELIADGSLVSTAPQIYVLA